MLSQNNIEIIMKEFVRLGAQKWQTMDDDEKERYRQLAEVDRIRCEREKLAMHRGGMPPENDHELQMQ